MDRQIVYPGAIPLDTDILSTQRNVMKALGYALQATFGTGTLVDGLTLAATSPASMQVTVGQGSIIALQEVDQNTFGSLAADTNPLVKMGINAEGVTLETLTAPTTSGQSRNYLIEATFLETATTPVTLPYYNAANPSQPYTGPGNSGTPQNTQVLSTVALQLKAGTAAAAGTQTTPAVDPGYFGLYVITVNYGQTTVTSSSWTTYPTAPFIGTKIPQMRSRLLGNVTMYVNGTTGNDGNNGFYPTTAFATLQGAWNAIVTLLDLSGFQVTVNVANGNYAGVVCVGEPVGGIGGVPNAPGAPGPSVTFVGNTGSPSSVVVTGVNSNGFYVGSGAQIGVRGFRLMASGTSSDYDQQGVGLYTFANGGIAFSNIDFNTCSTAHILSTTGSIIECAGAGVAYTISGGASAHIQAHEQGYVAISDATVTLTGSPAFSVAFAAAYNCSTITAALDTFSGGATGPRYAVSANSVINTNGAQATPTTAYLPGNAAGTTTTGGQIT